MAGFFIEVEDICMHSVHSERASVFAWPLLYNYCVFLHNIIE